MIAEWDSIWVYGMYTFCYPNVVLSATRLTRRAVLMHGATDGQRELRKFVLMGFSSQVSSLCGAEHMIFKTTRESLKRF